MTKLKRVTLAQQIILEGHAVVVPEELCETTGFLATSMAQRESKNGNCLLPEFNRQQIQDWVNRESGNHQLWKDLEPPKKRIEG